MAPNAPGQSVSLIEPIYITGRANDAIILGSSCITIAAKGMEIRCRAKPLCACGRVLGLW